MRQAHRRKSFLRMKGFGCCQMIGLCGQHVSKRAPGACINRLERGKSKPILTKSKVASASHQTLEQ